MVGEETQAHRRAHARARVVAAARRSSCRRRRSSRRIPRRPACWCASCSRPCRTVAPGGGGRVLDLYAGSGLFAVPLAIAGHVVTAVEENRQAVKDGEANQRLNRVATERLRWVAGAWTRGAGESSPRAARSFPSSSRPAAPGLPPEVIEAVFRRARAAAARCTSPATRGAGRGTARHRRGGLPPSRGVQPVDMFPHTEHIETVVTLDALASAGRAHRPRHGRGVVASRRQPPQVLEAYALAFPGVGARRREAVSAVA